jgi:hypothetical protein
VSGSLEVWQDCFFVGNCRNCDDLHNNMDSDVLALHIKALEKTTPETRRKKLFQPHVWAAA